MVEVSLLDERSVLQRLPEGAASYAYIASMAVDPAWQRQGVARALLRAAEAAAGVWREPQALLHVYADNLPAISLYEDSGYSTVYQDPGCGGEPRQPPAPPHAQAAGLRARLPRLPWYRRE